MHQLKIWIAIKQSTNLELNEPVLGVEMNVKYSHTHNNNHRLQMLTKRTTVRLTTRITMLWAPQKSLL